MAGAPAASAVVHALILLGLVFASYLHVEPLAEPVLERRLIKVITGPPPAAPAPPPSGSGSEAVEETQKAELVPTDPPDLIQPRDVPDEIPIFDRPHAVPGLVADGGDGVPGGIPGGVPGGEPGGIFGGVPGGIGDGVAGVGPGGVLDGLPGEDPPLHLSGAVRPPEKILHVSPLYPEVARKARVEGTVILEIVIGRTGVVEDVELLKSSPLFDAAAVEAVRKWKYQPALQNGRPVRVYLTVRIEFHLR